MFLPKPFDDIKCQPVTCEVVRSSEELLQRIRYCSKVKFSGYLALAAAKNQVWNLYFLNGWLIGGTGGVHAVRRWYRQVIRYCPQLGLELPIQTPEPSQDWDYSFLMGQVEDGRLSQSQLVAVVRGNLTEMLFDLIQAHHACDEPSTSAKTHQASEVRLSYHDFCQKVTVPPSVLVQPSAVLQSAMQAWRAWNQADLAQYSPNLAPVIQDDDALRGQTTPAAYHCLAQFVDGSLTLRDLAIKLKQYPILLTRSLVPFFVQGVIGLQPVPDLAYSPRPTPGSTQLAQPAAEGSLIAYIEDSQFDCMAMAQILEQTAHRFIGIRDPIQALPMLLEHKPSLIFLDVLMPMINGYEVCAQIRQISTLKATPVIIVTSSDGIVDRVRANLVGSSGFLAKPITVEKVLGTLEAHLPRSPQPSSSLFPPSRIQPAQTPYPETRVRR